MEFPPGCPDQTEGSQKTKKEGEKLMTPEECLEKGYKYFCMQCDKIYKELPVVTYEDGHGGSTRNFCRCECDLFMTFEELIKKRKS